MTREAAAGTQLLRAAHLWAVAAAVFLVVACGPPSANGGAEDGQSGAGNGNGNGGGDDGTVAWYVPPTGPVRPDWPPPVAQPPNRGRGL